MPVPVPTRPAGPVRGLPPAALAACLAGLLAGGCGSPPTGTTDPPVMLRLQKVIEFYQGYQADKKKPPADEKALQEYIRDLPPDRKQGPGMTADLDQLFTSPRDNKKFAVRYKLRLDPGTGGSEAVAWEQAGQDGTRFVALANGYVQEYADEDFAELKRK